MSTATARTTSSFRRGRRRYESPSRVSIAFRADSSETPPSARASPFRRAPRSPPSRTTTTMAGWTSSSSAARGAVTCSATAATVRFVDVTAKAGVADVKGARKALFVDLDHDGDLDLLLVGTGQRTVYRNNLDGTFTEATATLRSRRWRRRARRRLRRLRRRRTHRRLRRERAGQRRAPAQRWRAALQRRHRDEWPGDAAADRARRRWAITTTTDSSISSSRATNGGEPALWLNKGDGTFTRDRRSSAAVQALRARRRDWRQRHSSTTTMTAGSTSSSARAPAWRRCSGVFLFRNDGTGKFLDRSTLIPHRCAGRRRVRDRGHGRR